MYIYHSLPDVDVDADANADTASLLTRYPLKGERGNLYAAGAWAMMNLSIR